MNIDEYFWPAGKNIIEIENAMRMIEVELKNWRGKGKDRICPLLELANNSRIII